MSLYRPLYLTTALLMFLSGCALETSRTTLTPKQILDIPTSQQNWAAHWVSPSLILAKRQMDSAYLIASERANIDNTGRFNQSFKLKAVALPEGISERFPHLSTMQAYRVDITAEQAKTLVKNQLAVIFKDESQYPIELSFVQSAILLDQLYTAAKHDANESKQLGSAVERGLYHFAIWAPTARELKIKLFEQPNINAAVTTLPLVEDTQTGIWSAQTEENLDGMYYQYEIELYHPTTQKIERLMVTDPYSLSLSTNGHYSQVVNLADQSTKPDNWDTHRIPTVEKPEDLIIYETHIRDFSAHEQNPSNPDNRGKYAAFSDDNSDAIKHLKALNSAGLNTIHLLPTYDISTVNEDPKQVIDLHKSIEANCEIRELSLCDNTGIQKTSLSDYLSGLDPNTEAAQHIIEQIRAYDGFNWGYDPFHYTVPEGSYALDPEGKPRIVEFRQMIQSLHEMGFRVIMDVVYNHTFASGLTEKSVLDKVVPNYYHRLNPISGEIERSTCCENTATERAMMAKLMTDSLVVWAKHYKIDGFRFDLMGHQPKSVMLDARRAVRMVDPDTYFYGEGWNFGEVANNAQFVQASQAELAGTQIGTYTDRLRDAVRGGSSFVSGDDIRRGQGIGNGLLHIPNDLYGVDNLSQMLDEYFLSLDQIRVGLTGNLAHYPIQNAKSQQVIGSQIDYGGAPAGYALDPADTINYVSKHDNQTLWDNNQYRIAYHVSTEDRVRMQVLSLSYPLLAQGIPFLHMGSELLRSKSFLRDSYDFSDWFNKVDYSMQSNNYNVGLPPAEKDQDNWPLIQRILKHNQGRDIIGQDEIQKAAQMVMDLISIRSTIKLFRLSSAELIKQKLRFHNTGAAQQLGLIVMEIDDTVGPEVDPNIDSVVVIFNHGETQQHFAFDNAAQYALHPLLAQSADPRLREARTSQGQFTIPALSVAVFIR